MKEKLNELRKNRFLEISSWAGLSNMPGTNGLIITNDKMIYYYHVYHRIPRQYENFMGLESISDGKLLSEDVYLKLVTFIDKKIKGKQFDDIHIFDAGCSIKGNGFNIINNFDIYRDLKEIIGG